MDQKNTWTCPACGNRVELSADLGGEAVQPDHERLDRLAHAVCGCYVLQMPAGLVGRLLASVLAAGTGDEACPSDEEAAPERAALSRRRVSDPSAGRR